MEAGCAAWVLHQFVVQHMLIDLTDQKGISFLNGAMRLEIYLFMKELPKFSVGGPMIMKTWVSW